MSSTVYTYDYHLSPCLVLDIQEATVTTCTKWTVQNECKIIHHTIINLVDNYAMYSYTYGNQNLIRKPYLYFWCTCPKLAVELSVAVFRCWIRTSWGALMVYISTPTTCISFGLDYWATSLTGLSCLGSTDFVVALSVLTTCCFTRLRALERYCLNRAKYTCDSL